MKSFTCDCGNTVYFDNTLCLTCGKELAFAPELLEIKAITPTGDASYLVSDEPLLRYRKCRNSSEQSVCNWLVRADEGHELCLACRLNDVIPDLTVPENREKWARVEAAKRRLIFTLLSLSLPVVPKSMDPERGLAFDIMSDTPNLKVFTGHDNGLITLNLDEADPVLRERARVALSERYRTLLGHLRHESGHHYWDRLIAGSPRLEEYRAIFGDEQQDYGAALKRHYESPRSDWQESFVSVYATAHPWEDWAETFAHYLHMVDAMETAEAFGVTLPSGPYNSSADCEHLIDRFIELSVVLNALNRSMGQGDAYPFALGPGVRKKLAFVHDVISARPALRAAA